MHQLGHPSDRLGEAFKSHNMIKSYGPVFETMPRAGIVDPDSIGTSGVPDQRLRTIGYCRVRGPPKLIVAFANGYGLRTDPFFAVQNRAALWPEPITI